MIDMWPIHTGKDGGQSGKLDRLSWDENNPWRDPSPPDPIIKLYRMEQQRTGIQPRGGSVTDPGNNYGSNDRTMAFGGANTTDTMVVFAETGDIRVGDGSKQIHGQQVITDTERGDTQCPPDEVLYFTDSRWHRD